MKRAVYILVYAGRGPVLYAKRFRKNEGLLTRRNLERKDRQRQRVFMVRESRVRFRTHQQCDVAV